MKKGVTLFKAIVGCAAIAAIAGCASTNKPESATSKRTGSERQLNQVWAGKPYKDLLEAYGQPTNVMEYPNMRNTTVVVYRDNPKLPASCAHAFTVNHAGTSTVVSYFCR
ncbi:MAG TPA: hypothetical protein VEB70_05225 [Noviherbaspirillum sp.]|nr:hypothetical protein [Noviherbaspirillum sp.]